MWADQFVEATSKNLSEEILERLNVRGASDEQIRQFRIGSVQETLPEGVEYPERFLKWGNGGEKLKNCFCFPVTNLIGETVGFQFRSIDRAKSGYMDYILDKGEPAFFGLTQAAPFLWKYGKVLAVEGVFDMFPLHRHFEGVVPMLGAGVSEVFLRTLKRLCREVVLGYDGDRTGKRAAEDFRKNQATFFDKVTVMTCPERTLPNGEKIKDWAELWEHGGDSGVKEVISEFGL